MKESLTTVNDSFTYYRILHNMYRGDSMFSQILTDTLLIFLITYSIVDILTRLLGMIERNCESCTQNLKLLFYIESADNLENHIRGCAKKASSIKSEFVLILKDESEEINSIIEKLKSELPYLKIIKTDADAIDQIFEGISSKGA